ncbi:MAG: redoxin domain-containing protein [Phycisphaerales bacterium]|jgi:hypothetical protein|nr:redoxin domain-containing protein [Phycisphaerales bacterium]
MGVIPLLLAAVFVTTGAALRSGAIQSDESVVETPRASEVPNPPTRFSQDRLAAFVLADLAGVPRKVFEPDGPGLVVVTFISTTCPIANASVPEIRRLHEAVKAVGGRFFVVHPALGTTVESASAHAKERRLEMPVLLDLDQRLVREFNGTVVPEVFILTRVNDVWNLRYRGPLDNLYAEIGRRRRNATKAYARDAVSQIVSGRPVSITSRPAVGCLIEKNEKETP